MVAISLVIPVYNEADRLGVNFEKIREQIGQTGESFEFIFIDDGSTDETWSYLKTLSRNHNEVFAHRLSRNFGKESAVAAGLSVARGDAVIVMDSDLEHPPELIGKMIHIWREGHAQIVEGVKESRTPEGPLKRMLTKGYFFLFNALTGFDIAQATDYKLLDRSVLDSWAKLSERGVFFRGLVPWLGFRRVALPFHVGTRESGGSRFTYRKLFGLSLQSLISFSALPLYLIPVCGVLFMLFALVIGTISISQWMQGIAVEGFTTVIILQLFIGGTLLLGLGIIGLYLSQLYEEVKGRPRFIIAESTQEQKHSQ
ncbi:MAG: glycosyltransferase family 2 protein [Bdellovibrionales bacterium]|nr:glycosyltransferase family 2 protein [Bdellovibrionales bacterium]